MRPEDEHPPPPSHHQKSEGVQYATREEHGAITERMKPLGQSGSDAQWYGVWFCKKPTGV